MLSRTKGIYLIISVVMWEFFSCFGMRALFILYLTQKLTFSDQYAYAVYGAFTAMIFVTPVIGGWLADRFIGYRISIIFGSLLIMLGHFTLGISSIWSLYLGLSLLICGIGFFKSSALCLIGEYCDNGNISRNSAFTLYYVGGNIGATIAPIICAYLASKYGWQYGFAVAGIGMLCGLVLLFVFRKYLAGVGNPNISFRKATRKLNWNLIFWCFISVIGMLIFTDLVIVKLWTGYILLAISLVAAILAFKAYKQSNNTNRKGLILALVLTLFGTLFWIFDQQGGSSISLFILRDVNRHLTLQLGNWSFSYFIPTAMFQAINPAVVIIFGSAIAFGLRALAKANIKPTAVIQVLCGISMLTVGFLLIALAAQNVTVAGKTSMSWVVLGLTFVGSAEIFIDPVILSVINRVSPKQSLGVLTATYYLCVGAIANYLAAQLAKLTATQNLATAAVQYKNTYFEVFYIGIFMMLSLILLRFVVGKFKLE